MPNATNATPKKGTGKRRRPWKAIFLEHLARSPNVSAAAKAAAVSRQQAYKVREAEPEFALDWDDALQASIDALVGEGYRRAKKDSDTLLIFLLKSHRPETYRETVRAEHTGANGAPLVPISFIEPVQPPAVQPQPASEATGAP